MISPQRGEPDVFDELITCFVINLDSRPDRWRTTERMLERRGMSARRFSAHDREKGVATYPESRLQPSELGLWSSFVSVLRSGAGTEWILVLEDDAYLLPGFRRRAAQAATRADQGTAAIRLGWLGPFSIRMDDGVIGYVIRIIRWVRSNLKALLQGRWKQRESLVENMRFGTHALLVRTDSVERVLATLGSAENPLDVAFIRAERAEPAMFTLSGRTLAWQRPSRSDIHRDRKNHSTRRNRSAKTSRTE